MGGPAVWVVGDKGVGKHTLAQSVAGLDCDRSKSYSWQIDTKYYTADVDLYAFRFSQQHPEVDSPEAVVIVIDVTDEKTFLAAKSWSASDAWESAEIKILAANKVDQLLGTRGEPARPGWLLGAMEWCTENLCEYVEVCCGVPSKDSGLVLDSEQQGVARVVSVLQAHMWPGMSRKEVQHTFARADSDPESEEQEQEHEAEARSHQAQEQQGDAGVTVGSAGTAAAAAAATGVQPGASETQERRAPAESQSSTSAVGTDERGTNGSSGGGEAAALAATAAAAMKAEGGAGKQDEQDGQVDAFENLLQELQGARTRLAGLSDDKRRQAAAELAMRVAMMLDDGDDSDAVDDTDAELLRDV